MLIPFLKRALHQRWSPVFPFRARSHVLPAFFFSLITRRSSHAASAANDAEASEASKAIGHDGGSRSRVHIIGQRNDDKCAGDQVHQSRPVNQANQSKPGPLLDSVFSNVGSQSRVAHIAVETTVDQCLASWYTGNHLFDSWKLSQDLSLRDIRNAAKLTAPQ